MKKQINIWISLFAKLSLMTLIAGCNASFHDLGIPPQLTEPVSEVAVQSAMIRSQPMVVRGPQRIAMVDNAIWNKRQGIYFRDRRAFAIGDILTVHITMDDGARLNNRSGKDTNLKGSLVGDGTYLLKNGYNPVASVDASLAGKLDAERGGTVVRTEKISLQLAAVVVDASPNGNLQISGTQEVRVNHELRILTVQGVVRSKDILPDNTIAYEKIAEARISYGGLNSRAGLKRRRPLLARKAAPYKIYEKY